MWWSVFLFYLFSSPGTEKRTTILYSEEITPHLHLQYQDALGLRTFQAERTDCLFRSNIFLSNLSPSCYFEIYPPNQTVYFSMSQLATVRFTECIDRFVKGQIIVGRMICCDCLWASSRPICLLQMSLEDQASEPSVGQGRRLMGNVIFLWRVKCSLHVTC